MPFSESGEIETFYFDRLRESGLAHGIFTRRGGVSPEPWGTLNAGSLVGDAPERVAENLRRACLSLGREPVSLRLVRQVHGNDVQFFPEPNGAVDRRHFTDLLRAAEMPEADALVTASERLTLAMRFADCVPILLYDPVARAVGIAHAGWRGTLLDVAGRTVSEMVRLFGTKPADLLAGIGPSICPDHYEVGPEVVEQVEAVFGTETGRVIRSENGRTSFDLWSANRLLLESAGVRQVDVAGECTVDAPERWYSHRGEGGATGRFAVLAGIAVG
jgi:hypothetical protein